MTDILTAGLTELGLDTAAAAALERYALPHRDYYAWCGPNAGGFVLDARDWQREHILHLVKTVQYTKESQC